MKHFVFAPVLLLLTTFCSGQVVKQNDNETAEQFVTRMMPVNSILTHKVLTTKWNNTPVILAFYEQAYKLSEQDDPDQQNYFRIIATIFLQTESKHYRKMLIDTLDTEGSKPVIESVFFANADKDINKELIIIASWEQQHRDVNGTLYSTFVYDDLLTDAQMKLAFIKSISEKLSGGCECEWSDGTSKKAKFKNASDIKTELKRLGYRQ